MLVYGAGGHAKVVYECLKAQSQTVKCFVDPFRQKQHLFDIPILESYDPEYKTDDEMIIAIGDNQIRKQIAKTINHNFGTVIHSSSLISGTVLIGDGTVVFHNSVIQSSTTIGKHCIVNTHASVDHDCVVNNFVHIAPNTTICGNVKIGEGSFIGAGSTIIPNVSIGKWVKIGAGTVVINDIPDNVTVVGNPARII